MIKPLLLASVIFVAGCSGARIAPVDITDAGTTAIALADGGFVEMNPILAPAGDAAPLAALALKFGIKELLIRLGFEPDKANKIVETGSAFGTCNNIAVLAGATGPVGVVAGVTCALVYSNHK